MKLSQRRRVFVDGQLQGSLCIRVALYWFCCLMSVGLTLGAWSALEKGPLAIDKWSETLWSQFGPVLVVSTIILPFALLDCLIMSNKYAGPLYRIRLALKQLATIVGAAATSPPNESLEWRIDLPFFVSFVLASLRGGRAALRARKGHRDGSVRVTKESAAFVVGKAGVRRDDEEP